eukprot:scaffold714_cov121-Isochrysis_galbana.AAC.8
MCRCRTRCGDLNAVAGRSTEAATQHAVHNSIRRPAIVSSASAAASWTQGGCVRRCGMAITAPIFSSTTSCSRPAGPYAPTARRLVTSKFCCSGLERVDAKWHNLMHAEGGDG